MSHPWPSSAICSFLWVTLEPVRPGTHSHGRHRCVARSACWWTGSREESCKAGPQASIGSSLLFFLGYFAPLPHILLPSPLFSPPKLGFHNKCGLSFQFPHHWLVRDTSEGDRNTSAQDECAVHTTQGGRSSKKGQGHLLDSSGKRWVAFLVFSLSAPGENPAATRTCTLSSKLPGTFLGFLAGSAISTSRPDLSFPLLIWMNLCQFPFPFI